MFCNFIMGFSMVIMSTVSKLDEILKLSLTILKIGLLVVGACFMYTKGIPQLSGVLTAITDAVKTTGVRIVV